jgi:hypothetical protein
MKTTCYLPDEEPYIRNYPEIADVSLDIENLIAFGTRIGNAIDAYVSEKYDRVDIDIIELQKSIDLCRETCTYLSSAPKVCFDMLLELRELQSLMQLFLYLKDRYGNQFVGKPTNAAASSTSVG